MSSLPSYAETKTIGHSPIAESPLFLNDSYLGRFQEEVKGKIVDEQGTPISGATIREKNTNQSTQSAEDGTFTLQVSSHSSILVVSSIGFGQKEVPAMEASSISLQAAEDQIEEVVVVGFGTQKKVNLTGAIAHVGKEAFENRPVANIGQALQGLVPNLNISFGNGAPNTTPGFNLRGGTSMAYNANTKEFETVNGDPLVIIDGVENTTAALNQLNPNDIRDMSFIKDASASAIADTIP